MLQPELAGHAPEVRRDRRGQQVLGDEEHPVQSELPELARCMAEALAEVRLVDDRLGQERGVHERQG